jgi:hypothetical protein
LQYANNKHVAGLNLSYLRGRRQFFESGNKKINPFNQSRFRDFKNAGNDCQPLCILKYQNGTINRSYAIPEYIFDE